MGQRLINEVHESTVFWDMSDEKYKDNPVKDSIWKKIAQILDTSGVYTYICII